MFECFRVPAGEVGIHGVCNKHEFTSTRAHWRAVDDQHFIRETPVEAMTDCVANAPARSPDQGGGKEQTDREYLPRKRCAELQAEKEPQDETACDREASKTSSDSDHGSRERTRAICTVTRGEQHENGADQKKEVDAM
jgi:hypothetical protein